MKANDKYFSHECCFLMFFTLDLNFVKIPVFEISKSYIIERTVWLVYRDRRRDGISTLVSMSRALIGT